MLHRSLALAALLLAGSQGRAADPSPEPPPDVVCRPDGNTKDVRTTGNPRGLVVFVGRTSDRGQLTLEFRAAPPSRFTFHFPNQRGTHIFTFNDGKRSYQATLGWNGGTTTALFDQAGRRIDTAALAAVRITMQTTKAGGVDVLVAAPGLKQGKAVSASWQRLLEVRFGFTDS